MFNITVKEVYAVKENRMRAEFITDNFSFATQPSSLQMTQDFFFIESKIIFHKRNKICCRLVTLRAEIYKFAMEKQTKKLVHK